MVAVQPLYCCLACFVGVQLGTSSVISLWFRQSRREAAGSGSLIAGSQGVPRCGGHLHPTLLRPT
jgi:hypothetical protein